MRTIYVDQNIPKILAVKLLRPLWPGVVFSPLSPSRCAEVPEPPVPGDRWIKVKVHQCGVCGTDLSLFHAEVDPRIAPAALPGTERLYLGHEVVGRVVEAGPGVTRLALGQRVIMDTRFQGPTCASQEIEPPCRQCAEGRFSLCENAARERGPHGVGGGWSDAYTCHESEVYPVPEELSDDEAMMVEPFSTALRAVLRRLPEPGETAVVLGCGIVGLNVLQVLRALAPEARAIALARHPHQADLARRFGAAEVVRGRDPYQALAELTGSHLLEGMMGTRTLLGGATVVYDCVGSARSLEDSLRWARGRGTVVMVGIELAPLRLDLNPVWHQEVDLVGVCAHGSELWGEERLHPYAMLMDLLREGRLEVDGLITHRFPLDRWKEALRAAMDKSAGAVKVVLEMEGRLSAP